MWYSVKICSSCRTVLQYQNDNKWYRAAGKIFDNFCTFCGSNSAAQGVYTAKWISKSIWYNPLTWFTGEFILREDYLGQEEMKTKLAKVRKQVGLDS